jgi:hypothetical protein
MCQQFHHLDTCYRKMKTIWFTRLCLWKCVLLRSEERIVECVCVRLSTQMKTWRLSEGEGHGCESDLIETTSLVAVIDAKSHRDLSNFCILYFRLRSRFAKNVPRTYSMTLYARRVMHARSKSFPTLFAHRLLSALGVPYIHTYSYVSLFIQTYICTRSNVRRRCITESVKSVFQICILISREQLKSYATNFCVT